MESWALNPDLEAPGTGPGDLNSVHRGSITHTYGRGELPGSNTKGENKMKTYENRRIFPETPRALQ